MNSSFISSYCFSTLFTKTNSSWLLFESIKILEIKTSIVINLVSASNIMVVFLFLIIDLNFLIPAVVMEMFIVIAELAIPTKIPTKEARVEIET